MNPHTKSPEARRARGLKLVSVWLDETDADYLEAVSSRTETGSYSEGIRAALKLAYADFKKKR